VVSKDEISWDDVVALRGGDSIRSPSRELLRVADIAELDDDFGSGGYEVGPRRDDEGETVHVAFQMMRVG